MTSTTMESPAIAGVSPVQETTLEYVFPSIACNALGRFIGSVMGAVQGIGPLPVRLLLLIAVGGVLAGPAALLYFIVKVLGSSYTITNRSVQVRPVLGNDFTKQVKLADVAKIDIAVQDGYEFYDAGDVRLLDARDAELLTLIGVGGPQRVARLLIELRDAHAHSAASLKQIQARG